MKKFKYRLNLFAKLFEAVNFKLDKIDSSIEILSSELTKKLQSERYFNEISELKE